MCEPYHSINQFEDQGPNGCSGLIIKPLADIATKIRNWFHLSKAGAGHSEALTKALGGRFYDLRENKWEVAWWNREVKLDGDYRGIFDPADAKIACEKYADMTAIGDIRTFRRWFEAVLQKTHRPSTYLYVMERMFTAAGRDALAKAIRSVSPVKRYAPRVGMEPTLIKRVMGLTRKRELLIPEWADCPKSWVASPQYKSFDVSGRSGGTKSLSG